MDYRKLSIHHIGGRFGDGGLPVPKGFEKDVVRVFYDADKDCIEQIKEKHKDSPSEVHVLPYCIGESVRKGVFRINYDPTSSSVYGFNPDYSSFYFFSYNHDFVVEDAMRTMENRNVDVVPLDYLFKTEALGVVPPDFLSMDVQGSEYNILLGAKEALRQNVLGLLIETAFHPLYEGQKMFCDVKELLSDMGFYFIRFLRIMDYSPYRAPVGLRGEGFNVFTDALFLRRIDNITNTIDDDLRCHMMLRKLAFMSITFNQFEYGLKCLNQSIGKKKTYYGEFKDTSYYKFLDDIERNAERMPSRSPKTFSEKYTFDLSKRRFSSSKSIHENVSGKKSIGEMIWLRFVYPNIYFVARTYDFLIQKVWANIASFILPDSPVERVLKRCDFKEQARLLKKSRVVQLLFSRRQNS